MIALLTWVDGFGCDTNVKGIFSTIEEARPFMKKDDRYVYFESGLTNFDYYSADPVDEFLHPNWKFYLFSDTDYENFYIVNAPSREEAFKKMIDEGFADHEFEYHTYYKTRKELDSQKFYYEMV